MLRLLTIIAASSLIPLAACGPEAVVVMRQGGNGTVVGSLELTHEDGGIHIYGHIEGLSPGKHGIHVHTWGDLTSGCDSVGTHFNPTGKTHGGPQSAERHVGDLGNIETFAHDDATFVDIYDKVISFSGENNILARSIVIHNGEDDLGLGGFNDSKTTGHSGTRFACGIIGLANSTSP